MQIGHSVRMTVLVTGATGFVGGHVVGALRAAGHPVRALVRRPMNATTLRDLGCELAEGDMTDAASLARATEGVDAVVHLVAIIAGKPADFVRIMEQGTRDLVAAAQQAGTVTRWVQMSALGTSDATKDLVPYFHAKWEIEKMVEASGIPYVIFRPSFVFAPDGGVLPGFARMAKLAPLMPVPGNGKQRIQPIWADDVAAFFVKALDLDAATNRTFEIGGPDKVTWDELYARLRRTARRRGATLHMPLALMRPGAALAERLPKPPVTRDMLKMLEAGDNATDSTDAVETFGFPLVPLDEQLRRVV
jgi:NADH dehydrogenase